MEGGFKMSRFVKLCVVLVFVLSIDCLADGLGDVLLYDGGNGGRWLGAKTGEGGVLGGEGYSNELYYGSASLKPLVGDLTGDGRDDLILYDGGNGGRWLGVYTGVDGVLGGGGYSNELNYGSASLAPMVGDITGDGLADLVLYSPGRWLSSYTGTGGVLGGGGTSNEFFWGGAYTPLLTDLTGDGLDDVLLYDAGNGRWMAAYTGAGGVLGGGGYSNQLYWGASDLAPLVGDINGDGTSDLLLYKPENGRWLVSYTGLGGVLGGGGYSGEFYWGGSTLTPLLGDFGGNVPEPATLLLLSVGGIYLTRRKSIKR